MSNDNGKSPERVDYLWPMTIPVDTWIMENISFFLNNWRQRIQPGSRCIMHHSDNIEYDLISYALDPSSNDPIFHIRYYLEHCSISGMQDENAKAATLEYATPTFFDSLDRIIWRIRTIQYILADLRSAIGNLNILTDVFWEHRDWFTQADLTKTIYEQTGKLDSTIREMVAKYAERHLERGEMTIFYPLLENRRVPTEIPF